MKDMLKDVLEGLTRGLAENSNSLNGEERESVLCQITSSNQLLKRS